MTEYEIHKAVVDHLRTRAPDDVLWFHTPNAPRNAIQGARLKKMGMLAGVPDLLLFWSKQQFALELKSAKGRSSDAQKEFAERWRACGGYYYVAKSLDEALAWLKLQGLII